MSSSLTTLSPCTLPPSRRTPSGVWETRSSMVLPPTPTPRSLEPGSCDGGSGWPSGGCAWRRPSCLSLTSSKAQTGTHFSAAHSQEPTKKTLLGAEPHCPHGKGTCCATRAAGRKHSHDLGRRDHESILSAFLHFLTKQLFMVQKNAVHYLTELCVHIYISRLHKILLQYNNSLTQTPASSLGLLPQNPVLLASDEKIALIYTRGCTCLQRSTGPHARNFMKLFSLLLLRVTKHI